PSTPCRWRRASPGGPVPGSCWPTSASPPPSMASSPSTRWAAPATGTPSRPTCAGPTNGWGPWAPARRTAFSWRGRSPAPCTRGPAVGGGAAGGVMAPRGHAPLSRFGRGSVADELVRRLPMPLLLLRPGEGPADLAREPVFRRVLVPLDGSARAEAALDPATTL